MDRIMLSTDIGTDIDDAFCLLTMFNAGICPEIVYTTNGNVLRRAFVAKHMVNLFGAKTKVAMGEAESLRKNVQSFDYYVEGNVDDSFVDLKKSDEARSTVYKKPARFGIIENGVQDMANRLRKNPYVIFSVAPLTNIARLLELHPDAVKNIKRLYVMGCRLFDSETRLEHNIKYDPDAAKVVFESDIPITVVPGDVCSRYRMPSDFIERLSSPCGMYVKKMATTYLALLTHKEFRMASSNKVISEALELDGMYKQINSIADVAERDKALKKVRYYKEVLEDSFCAIYESEEYLRILHEVIQHIQSSRGDYRFAEHVVSMLRETIPSSFSVADAYIPFCYLHEEAIKSFMDTVAFSPPLGESYLCGGEKHKIISAVDSSQFENFLRNNLK